MSENPINNLLDDELDENLLKFNSLVSIIHNKRLNHVTIFTLLVKEKKIRDIFKVICQVQNDRTCIRLYLKYNIKLCRSKVVKNLLKDNDF